MYHKKHSKSSAIHRKYEPMKNK